MNRFERERTLMSFGNILETTRVDASRRISLMCTTTTTTDQESKPLLTEQQRNVKYTMPACETLQYSINEM